MENHKNLDVALLPKNLESRLLGESFFIDRKMPIHMYEVLPAIKLTCLMW